MVAMAFDISVLFLVWLQVSWWVLQNRNRRWLALSLLRPVLPE